MDFQTFFTLIIGLAIATCVSVVVYGLQDVRATLAQRAVIIALISNLVLCVWYGGTNDMQRVVRYTIATSVGAIFILFACIALDHIKQKNSSLDIFSDIYKLLQK